MKLLDGLVRDAFVVAMAFTIDRGIRRERFPSGAWYVFGAAGVAWLVAGFLTRGTP
jgi:hypothetical protein